MQRSTVLFLLFLFVAAALAGVWYQGSGRGMAVVPGPLDATGDADGGDPVPSPTSSSPATLPSSAPWVQLEVRQLERFRPPVVLPRLAERVDGTPLAARVVAGALAGFDVAPRARGLAMIEVAVGTGILLRQVGVDPEVLRPTRIGAPAVVVGTVTNGDGAPLVGATVWLGARDGAGQRRTFLSDEQGRFEAEAPSGTGVPLVVSAPGHATSWRAIDVLHGMLPVPVLLQPGIDLTVQLAGLGVAVERARAYVVPVARVATGVAQWPFFLQELAGGAAFDDAGRAMVVGLPAHGEVAVVVRHPLVPAGAPVAVPLDRLRGPVVVPLAVASEQRVLRVVDERGEPLAQVHAWCHDGRARFDGARSLRLLPPHLDLRGVCYANARGDEVLRIGVPADEAVTLSLRAHGHAGRDLVMRELGDEPVVLPRWRGAGDAALVIAPPVAGTAWRLTCNLGGGLDEVCEADRDFEVSLPSAGRFAITVTVDDGEPRVLDPVTVLEPLPLATARD